MLAGATAMTAPLAARAQETTLPTVTTIEGGALRTVGVGQPRVLKVRPAAAPVTVQRSTLPPLGASGPLPDVDTELLNAPAATAEAVAAPVDPAPVEAAPLAPAPVEAAEAPAPVAAEPTRVATTEPAPVAEPAGTLSREPASASVRMAIEALQRDPAFTAKRRLAAVAAFYQERGDRPAWIVDGAATPAAEAVAERLRAAAADGLDPAALGIPDVAADGPGAADRDVALSLAVVAYSDQASGGRVDPARIDAKNITRKPPRLDPIASLRDVAGAADPAAVLDGFNPPQEGYRRLKAALAAVRARGEPTEEHAPIAEGPTLKPGMRDVRVASLRDRLGVAGGTLTDTDADLYDPSVVEAVKSYQEKAGIIPDGIIGPRTLAVLNGVDRDEEGEIVANMEMWRWMPRDLGRDHIFVNVPEFMVRVVRDGSVTHSARVVVGTVKNQTPIFSDEMEYLVVNPYWNVPESIKIKEMLPEIQANPAAYFARNGYEVLWNGQPVDPTRVIWDENAVKAVHIRQVPGEANALGNIKFMFPNQHAVYLHDTPSRKLFGRTVRAFSHGCVRVDEPLEFARAVLDGEPEWTADKVQALYGGQERRLDLTHHLKVHIAYFNTWVDDAGTLQMRDDLYGHTKAVKAALGL